VNPQERADRLRIFRSELEELERARVLDLTAEQRAGLDAHVERTLSELAAQYDIDKSEPERQISLGMRIASALGGLALCAAVVLFLANYLGYWPTWVEVVVLIAIPLFLTYAAEFAAVREKTLYYTTLISLVAFAAFVADLYMLGSIYNLAPSPNALAVWGVFGLALAYHFGVRLVLAAGLISLLGWVSATTSLWLGWWWLDFERRPENVVLGGVLLTAAPLVLRHERRSEFPAVFRLVGMFAVFLPILFLSADGYDSYLPWEPVTIQHFYQMTGLIAAGVAVWIGIRRNWTGMVNTGTAFFAVFLFFRLIDWWWDSIPKYLFFLLIGTVAIGLVAMFKRLRSRVAL
jgi:uncharacterized membrane protein